MQAKHVVLLLIETSILRIKRTCIYIGFMKFTTKIWNKQIFCGLFCDQQISNFTLENILI